ncbi:nucleotide-binding protein [Vibrio parahaemolyticus]|nr:nucleotide-binding protein [Vibrio parahaemolyticus]ELB2100075.1 nucleotide-binding protein [Vibrio parahaemolyticus]ELB2209771.1 nucleotide-binding protein [Vibrio parahaemolyticus]ELB2289736.1 nucleotide-binding protein [Vibrio parahaemolyticus]
MSKPRLFIASSSESYDVASACNICLDRKVDVTIWDKIFEPGGNTLGSLTTKAQTFDFALFIFSPDDITNMRERVTPTVRDNVLFELGLFIGALGKERCFILKPRDEQLHMPTDLLGVNTHDYDSNRCLEELSSAVNAACTLFTRQIEKLGVFKHKAQNLIKVSEGKGAPQYSVNDDMFRMMAKLLPTLTDTTSLNSYEFKDGLHDYKFNLSLMKLERLNLIERVNVSDFNGNEWLGYKLTQDGGDFLLDNEERLDKLLAPPRPPKQDDLDIPLDFDDDIPF